MIHLNRDHRHDDPIHEGDVCLGNQVEVLGVIGNMLAQHQLQQIPFPGIEGR
jgi:hypothetical protein